MQLADRAFVRRLFSIGAVGFGLPLWILLTPVWAVVAVIADMIGRLWRFPTVRLCLFLAVYLVHEWIAVILATWLWLTGSFGHRLDLGTHRAVQAWWGSSLLRWAGRLLSVHFDFGDTEFPEGRFILLSRHASMVDAVIPSLLVTGKLRRFAHYVIKRELRWDPALDLFGTRLGNHFVARGRDTKREEESINGLAVGALPRSGLIIFPEGTYATVETRARVLQSLKRHGDATAVAEAEALQVLLPPKPAGTLALLRGRPDADVVIVGHVGLGGVAQLRGLRRRLPLRDPVIVRWWVHPRAELPSTEDDLVRWLNDRWRELDRWVVETRISRQVS